MFKVPGLMFHVFTLREISTRKGMICIENNLKPQTLNFKLVYVDAAKN
jgi:hypothetical protein